MAWVTFEDLLAKAGVTGASKERTDAFGAVGSASPVFNAGNLKKLTKNEEGALYELYNSAIEVMKQAGVPPDSVRQISNVTDSGDFSYEIPNWNLDTIKNTLTSRGVNLAYDPSRDKGNYGSAGSYSIQLGVLDSSGKPVQEYRAGEGSLGAGFLKGFVVPFATLALGAGGAATSIGSSIVGSAAPAAVQKAVGSAVISGASTALTGGDPEDVIKNALTAGAVVGAGSLLAPYVQDAIDFVKDLSPGELEQVASSVDATAGAGDVAGDLGAVEQGGNVLNAYPEEGAIRLARYNDLRDMGMPHDVAFAQVASELGELGPITAPATGNIGNALTPSFGALEEAGNLGGYQEVGFQNVTPAAPAGGIPTVETTALPERPLAGTTGLGIATGAAGAGALGAGALGAEAAGAAGTVGNGLTVPPGAGLGDAGLITTPDGLSSTVAGGTGITAGTTGGAGLDTSGLALGGTLGAGLTGSALPVGSAAAGGSAITPPAAATPTGIPMVDDFLNYLGTPAGALALSAFGSLAGGYFQGQAAKEAAQTQATAAQNALKLQQDMFEYQKSLLDPYQKAGKAALDRLTGTMGLGGTGSPQQMLEMDPGYAFRLGEGMKALERVQAARGNMLSGGAIKAGQRYAQDVASQEYGNAYNRLSNIAGLGQTAGTQLGAAGQQFGQTAGSAMGDVANSLAAGRVGRASAYTQGFGGAANAYTDYFNRQQQNQLFRDIYGRTVGG